MPNTTCHMSISLDGFVAGPEQSREDPLGKRGSELHGWHSGDPRANDADQIANGWLMRPRGAYVMGRNMFGPVRGDWDEDWTGWWGPEPPYHAGPAAAGLGATAMCDVSDGLIADLGHIAEASKVRIDIRSGAIDIPSQMNDIGQAVGVDPMQWVLTGGEDHAIVATFPPDVKLPARWKVIGEVLNPSALPQVTVDGAPWTTQGGWDHFGDIES